MHRDLEAAHLRLQYDYFNDDCVYPVILSPDVSYDPLYFYRRYHIQRTLFLNIMHKLSEIALYFTERHDATGHIGLISLQKCTSALCQLAYVMPADMIDEYLKLGKTTTL
jgi:hypothetical protein